MKGLVLIQRWVLVPLNTYCKMFNQVDRWMVFTNAATGIFLRIKCQIQEELRQECFSNFRNYTRDFSNQLGEVLLKQLTNY